MHEAGLCCDRDLGCDPTPNDGIKNNDGREYTPAEITLRAERQVTSLLQVYEPAGLSFALGDVVIVDNATQAAFKGTFASRYEVELDANGEEVAKRDRNGKEIEKSIYKELKSEAEAEPGVITFMLTEGWAYAAFSGTGEPVVWGGGPMVWKPRLLAHELGHSLASATRTLALTTRATRRRSQKGLGNLAGTASTASNSTTGPPCGMMNVRSMLKTAPRLTPRTWRTGVEGTASARSSTRTGMSLPALGLPEQDLAHQAVPTARFDHLTSTLLGGHYACLPGAVDRVDWPSSTGAPNHPWIQDVGSGHRTRGNAVVVLAVLRRW